MIPTDVKCMMFDLFYEAYQKDGQLKQAMMLVERFKEEGMKAQASLEAMSKENVEIKREAELLAKQVEKKLDNAVPSEVKEEVGA